MCTASCGAPHIRQRLYWVADANGMRTESGDDEGGNRRSASPSSSAVDRLADADGGDSCAEGLQRGGEQRFEPQDGGVGCGMDNPASARCQPEGERPEGEARDETWLCGPQPGRSDGGLADSESGRIHRRQFNPSAKRLSQDTEPNDGGHWSNAILIPCADGKARRIEPTIQPLAHGLSGRVGLLRGAGNAIVPQVAAEFITVFCATLIPRSRA